MTWYGLLYTYTHLYTLLPSCLRIGTHLYNELSLLPKMFSFGVLTKDESIMIVDINLMYDLEWLVVYVVEGHLL